MENVKKYELWKLAAITLVLCFLIVIVLCPLIGRASPDSSMSVQSQATSTERTINITGSADILVAPDEVDITVGIETRNVNFQKAKAENDENAKKVMDLTKKYGIDSKYVQSDYIRTYPSYNYEKYTETTKISYYTVQKRIVIKLKNIEQFEPIISELTDSGAIMIQNIDFRSTELSEYKNEARRLAARAAKDKANLLASELGGSVGKVVTINEEQVFDYTWYGSWWGGSWYGYGQPNLASNVAVNYQNNQSLSGFDQGGETLSIGQIKITARIGVVFEIR